MKPSNRICVLDSKFVHGLISGYLPVFMVFNYRPRLNRFSHVSKIARLNSVDNRVTLGHLGSLRVTWGHWAAQLLSLLILKCFNEFWRRFNTFKSWLEGFEWPQMTSDDIEWPQMTSYDLLRSWIKQRLYLSLYYDLSFIHDLERS